MSVVRRCALAPLSVAVLAVLLAPAVADARAAAHHPAAKAHGHKRIASRRAIAPHHAAAPHALAITEHGQSRGAPWAGHLADPAQLTDGDDYHIRRPWRSFGTAATVELVQRVLDDNHDWFPHVLAIGDLSAEHGGPITEHHSHQTGRDADIGLFYTEQPASYPASFVRATADNLDCEATWKLLRAFAATAREDGGAQMIFLDYGVQGLLYQWAVDHEVADDVLDRLLQYPRGKSFMGSLVKHWPNHDNHMHVRFKCASADASCQ